MIINDKAIFIESEQHILNEELKIISQELGHDVDGKTAVKTQFENRMKQLKVPQEVKEVFDQVYILQFNKAYNIFATI